MILSYATLLSTLLLSSSIVLILVFLLKMMKIDQVFSATLLMIVSIIFIIRLCLPVEYFFTYTLPSDKVLPFFDSLLNKKIFLSGNMSFELKYLFTGIWITGSLFCFKRFLMMVHKIYYIKKRLSINTSFIYKNKKVIIVNQAISPFVIGLIHPIIVLPTLKLTNHQVKYILEHELFHISSFDIWIKYLYEIVSIVYWWNPVVYIFKSSFNQIIELKADENVISNFDAKERIEYVETLFQVKKQINENSFERDLNYFPSFTSSKQSFLVDRANNIFSKKRGRPHVSIIFLLSLFCFYLSSCVVFESFVPDPIIENTTIEISNNDSFLVKENANKYKVFKKGNFLFEVSEEDRKSQFSNIKVYNTFEEGERNAKKNN